MERCINVEELSELFRISTSEIRRLAGAREIPHLRIGRRYVFTDAHVAAIRERYEQPVVPVRALPRRRHA